MSKPPERIASKLLGVFSLGLGVAQIAAPDRINKLIGVEDTPRARTIQRLIGAQELSAAQGIFAFSPPTPILWSRVVGDAVHGALLARAFGGRRSDRDRLRTALAAVAGIALVDTVVAARYQARWPKEPTGVEPLPTSRGTEEPLEASVPGNPSITILASEAEIRPRLQELGIEGYGTVTFTTAPGERGTEVHVETEKKTDKVKADLRRAKQLVEVGEIVRSDGAPEGGQGKRQLFQRPAKPLDEKQLQKIGGKA